MHHHDSPLAPRLALAFIVSMMSASLSAAPGEEPPQPKLVVGIMVDDLQEDYINLLKQQFAKGGFNRLLNNSVAIKSVDYGTPLDPTAATAVIYTGATPALNGIPASTIFDRTTLVPIGIFTDTQYLGNYTEQTISPNRLLTSTLTDEIRISGDGSTLAYSFAADPEMSIVMGGHTANCSMWINDANGHWATTTYFKDVPKVFGKRNLELPLSTRMDTITWCPMLSSSRYISIPQSLIKNGFKYTFEKKGPRSMQAIKNSPLINTEITDMVIENINSLNFGQNDGPDIINIAYSLEPYAFAKDSDNRYELIDSYYRLDHDLQKLFQAIDNKVGLSNTLIFLASTPPSQRSRRDNRKWQIPYGEFSTRRAMSLLNLYFISIYGNDNWVQGYHNNEFFLNHDAIKKANLDLGTMRQQAAAFLVQMAGVSAAYSLDDIINNRAGIHAAPLKENTNIALAGDVKIKVLPGWELLDDFNHPKVKPDQVARETAPIGTAWIMAPGLAPTTITELVDARSIAPTICRLLRIRSPNGAAQAPLVLK